MSFLSFLLLVLQSYEATRIVNYWESYSTESNCAFEANLTKISVENPDHCVTNSLEDSHASIELCKQQLAEKLTSRGECDVEVVTKDQAGEMLYCKNNGMTKCCIHKFKCSHKQSIKEDIGVTAFRYMKDKKSFLKKEKIKRGYRRCYPVNGLDASKCAKDCDEILADPSYPLRRHCDKMNGLLKCCVRREKAYCHECRYCCTLPFCSYKDDNRTIVVGEEYFGDKEEMEQQEISLLAIYDMRATKTFYKDYDNRCLKPEYRKDKKPKYPAKWDYYDPDDYYYATTQEALDKAKTIKFNKNFFNFEDPEVLYSFMDPKQKSIWKKTYGYDYVNMEHSLENPSEKTYVECERTRRRSKFAQTCRKDGGFFNCCVKKTWLGEFQKIRQNLTQEKLIEETVSDKKLEKENFFGSMITMTYSCAQNDKYSGDIKLKSKTKAANPFGGTMITSSSGQEHRLGWQHIFCWTFNMCASNEVFPPSFALVSSRQKFCEHEAKHASNHWYDPPAMENIEDCKKRKSLIRPCPKDTLEALNTTGERNLLFKDIHVDLNNNLIAMIKKMKTQLKKNRRRKKSKKGKKD